MARGCLACSAFADVEDEEVLLYIEEWATQEDLSERLRNVDLRILLSVLDLASEAPSVRMDVISETSGMERIAVTRAQGSQP